MARPIDYDKFATDFTELIGVEAAINQRLKGGRGAAKDKTDLRALVKEWLEMARFVAQKYRAKEFTVETSVGWPPAVHLSVSWDVPREEEKAGTKA